MKSNKQKLIGIKIFLVLIFIISWNYYFDKEHLISNTVNGIRIGRISYTLGACISLLLFYMFEKIDYLKIKKISFIILFGTLFIPTMLVAKFGYHLNQIIGDPEKTTHLAIVQNKSSDIIFQNHRLTIEFEEAIERLTVSKKLWNRLKIGDTIEFQVQQGYFGFKIINEIIKKD